MTDFDPQNYQPYDYTSAYVYYDNPRKSNEKPPPPPPPQYLLDTLNESVCRTIGRDLKLMGLRTLYVIWIFKRPASPEVYEQWDIFGPLFYALALSLLYHFSYSQRGVPFEAVVPMTICVIFLLALVIAINVSCIGGKAQVMGTISLMGYCCAPLVLGAIVVLVLFCVNFGPHWLLYLVCLLVAAGLTVWSVLAAFGFFRSAVPRGKVALGLYPVVLYYIVLAFIMVAPGIGTFDAKPAE